MEAGERAIMRVLAKLMMAELCLLGKPAVMGSDGATAIKPPNTLNHVARQIPSVMHVTYYHSSRCVIQARMQKFH